MHMLATRLEGTPPTSNHIYKSSYVRTKGGGGFVAVHLSADAKRYKRDVIKQLLSCGVLQLMQASKTEGYYLTLVFHMQLLTKGWPKHAVNRFLPFDVSNLVKLLEDAIKEVTQVDDSQTCELIVCKRQLKEGEVPYVEIFYGMLEERDWLL